MPAPIQRSRPRYALAVALTIATGLLWRSGLIPFSDFISKYGGDALWALMMFFGCGFILSRSSTARVAIVAIGISWAVEFLQLYHAEWIETLRATRVGKLVLGATFNAPDLLAYVLGVGLGVLIELGGRKRKVSANPRA